jgi:hypothetical protein
MIRHFSSLICAAAILVATNASSQAITIPAGTKVLGELDQQVTSDVKKFEVGDIVRGHVWRNVVVEGQTVIQAGAPMTLRVADITKRKIAGRGGDVEVQAVSVNAVDGTEIFLDGGYDKQGSHRTGLSASLSALVFWPAIFIRGKEAVLEPGTVFDASVPANTRVATQERSRTIRLNAATALSVEVLYDEMDEKSKDLPLRIEICREGPTTSVEIRDVNDAPITPIQVAVETTEQQGACTIGKGAVELKTLSAHFRRGINRFTVANGTDAAEVVLDIEM